MTKTEKNLIEMALHDANQWHLSYLETIKGVTGFEDIVRWTVKRIMDNIMLRQKIKSKQHV